MTNSYDPDDPRDPHEYQQNSPRIYPRDLDREAEDARLWQQQQANKGQPEAPEASAIRSRLATNLRIAGEEARNLETFYSNFARTLELCLSQLETKK